MVSFPTVYQRVVVHWRAIILLVILVCAAFQVVRSNKSGPFDLMELALLLIFTASQLFWIGRILA